MLVVSCLTISCFSVSRRGGIAGIQGRTLHNGVRAFEVGPLPVEWSPPHNQLKQAVYTHEGMQATIVTDALCGKKFEDAPLKRLAADLFEPLEKAHVKSENGFVLDGRNAYRIMGEGALDGVPMGMAVVVLKKDFCLYDFVLFAPPKHFPAAEKDFKDYVSGFRTR